MPMGTVRVRLRVHPTYFTVLRAGIVYVCHFVRYLMAFVCREIKGLLTYLPAYLYTA